MPWGSDGLATSLATGSTQITATLGTVISTAVTFTVTPAILASIALTPAAPGVALGGTQQFAATGTYTDNSTQDLTTRVTWTSSNTAVALISSATGSNGLATSLTTGSTQITATLGSVISPDTPLIVAQAFAYVANGV